MGSLENNAHSEGLPFDLKLSGSVKGEGRGFRLRFLSEGQCGDRVEVNVWLPHAVMARQMLAKLMREVAEVIDVHTVGVRGEKLNML